MKWQNIPLVSLIESLSCMVPNYLLFKWNGFTVFVLALHIIASNVHENDLLLKHGLGMRKPYFVWLFFPPTHCRHVPNEPDWVQSTVF